MQVKKGFLGYFYNHCDFFVRFLYCRFPVINKLLFWKLYSSDLDQLDKDFEEMKKKVNFNNKICLELGPGNSFLMAYNCLMSGAKKVILVDKFSRHIKSEKQKEFFQKELDFIRSKYGKELFFFKDGQLDRRYIDFVIGDITKMHFEQKVDLVYSISVLEHVKSVKETIKALSKVLKKDGLMYHHIDLRDHYNFEQPFLFYKYSDKVWNKYLTREGVSYTNRIRYREFMNFFLDSSLKVVSDRKERFIFKVKKISRKYSNMKNLDIGIMKVLLKKL